MTQHILLDSSPLGLISSPTANAEVMSITRWVRECLTAGHLVYVPEVIDYEVRRELLRAGKLKGILKLDALNEQLVYVPITTSAMLRAADLWAHSRRTGIPTGDPKRLDIDAILAAQALTLPVSPVDIVVATSNVGHLSRFVAAVEWRDIIP